MLVKIDFLYTDIHIVALTQCTVKMIFEHRCSFYCINKVYSQVGFLYTEAHFVALTKCTYKLIFGTLMVTLLL